jgi:ribosomal protein S18 acetylase RimI-like enzyme
MTIEVLVADYVNAQHGTDIRYLLDRYSTDPMGAGRNLSEFVKENLITKLANIPHAMSILCYVDDEPAGLTNCFEGFSTFQCKPLINVHDVIVLNQFRGLGISQRMLDRVELSARAKGCCKITLEVLEGNKTAQGAYTKHGFHGYELDPAMGKALFWEKPL